MRLRAALTVAGLLMLVAGCGGSAPAPPPTPFVPLVSLSKSGAGHRFYEIYDPVGPARGTILMIHGGAWKDQRGDARHYMATTALAFRQLGWRVVNIGYSSGQEPPGETPDPRPMLRDVEAFYDQVHRAFGGPICAYGDSAGGYLSTELAILRPSLTCAIPNAAPFDLPTLADHTDPRVKPYILRTFGTRRSDLAKYSPARQWRAGVDHTPVFATGTADDKVVPPQQLQAFHAADPSADVASIPPGSLTWEHGTVNPSALQARLVSLYQWLDRVAPSPASAPTPPSADIGARCDTPVSDADRWKLLLAGDAWQAASTPRQPIAATRGCSGSAKWQDDGLSLWALTSPSAVLPAGAQASLALSTGHVLHRLSAAFRGFLVSPQDWVVGLYASTSAQGPIDTPVAACVRGRCSGLRLASAATGALIAAGGSHGDPDQQDQPTSASFTLPAGTRRVAWELRCAAPGGCSLGGIATWPGPSLRARDPLGQPAIFSVYSVQVH